jgi:hypothetical protein
LRRGPRLSKRADVLYGRRGIDGRVRLNDVPMRASHVVR